MINKQRILIKKMVIFQTIIMFMVIALGSIWLNPSSLLAILAATVVIILPNVLFALKLFQHHGAKAARKIVNAFYVGEAIKLIMSALLFFVAIIWLPMNMLVFFLAVLFNQVLAILVTIMISNKG
jgi:ATP synthase protein I